MPRSSALRVPSYRRHKPTGQAVVTLNGRDLYLGKWNTAASRAVYDRLIAEFLAHGRRLPSDADGTVVEVPDDGSRTSSHSEDLSLESSRGRCLS